MYTVCSQSRMQPHYTTHRNRVFLFRCVFICAVAMVLSVGAYADEQTRIGDSRRNAIVTAIEKVSPAVVTINVVDIQRSRSMDPLFHDFLGLFNRRMPQPQIRERRVESIGSGFIFDATGHILTNFHVLQGADEITSATLPDGRQLDVEFIGADERTDIAILQAKGDNLPFIPLGDSEQLIIGEWAIAIGNPFGTMMTDPQPSVSVGVVSANHRRVRREIGGGERLYQDMIQTDAAINPGNSGGPLVNASGEAIGVNTMILSSSGGHQGLGFAIPANRVKRVADEIITHGRRRTPWIGIHGEGVTELRPFQLEQLQLHAKIGVLVTEIHTQSPAFAEGLRTGDVITKMNGEIVEHPTEIDFLNWDLFVGDEVVLLVDRQGALLKMTFTIKEIQAGY